MDDVRATTRGERVWLEYLGMALVAAIVVGVAWWRFGAPVPFISDEFSYLFSAETFVRGRLANPSPALPEAFWSPHVLVEPAFASKYPPGQGLVLALGLMFGHAAFGLMLSAMVAAAALHWAARALLPRWAALTTTLLFAISALYLGDWTRTYMGGLVAFAAACLVIGFFLRAHRGQPTRAAFCLLGVGLGGLALTRPFEGAIVALLCGLLYLAPMLAVSRRQPREWMHGSAWAMAIVGLALSFQVAVNLRVTGQATRLPHMEFQAQYMQLPALAWQKPRAPAKPNSRLHEAELALWNQGSWIGRTGASLRGALSAAQDVGGVLLPYVVLLGLPFLLWLHWRLGAVLLMFPFLHAASRYVDFSPYFAPVAPIWFLAVGSLLTATHWPALRSRGGIVGLSLVIAALAVPRVAERATPHRFSHRADLVAALQSQEPGLVFVRYGASVNPHLNIVYNSPDLDDPLLLANDLGQTSNCALLHQYPGRNSFIATIEERGIQIDVGPRLPDCALTGEAAAGSARRD